MKNSFRTLIALPIALPVFMGSLFVMNSPAQDGPEIGGQKIVTLTRTAVSKTKPEFTSVTLAPGRGMELIQITANFPGKGSVNVLASPDLAGAKQMLDEKDDANGDLGYRWARRSWFPIPTAFAASSRPTGRRSPPHGKATRLPLPANNIGKNPGAERHAMHGLILKAKTDDVHVKDIPGGQEVTGVIHAGDFGGHWLSKTDLDFTIALTAEAIDATIVAHNVGSEAEPIAIGWHPYFALPSGDRTQVRIHIPGSNLAEVDNYDNVFPTGKLKPVDGTQYDLRAADGVPLAHNFYDDNWSKLDWKNGAVTVKVIDPAAHYGVDIVGLSPEIKTIQMYAPPPMQFVAIEDQFNFANPFGKEWGKMDTGMVTLKPGASTKWHVRLHVFVP